ncbi:hypothetical protein M422DRAFT_22844 [Sphaerobolus stellatus SS14]|nr:hypothetical protein M422DRAFT_22844 [Sphaerobolus stellatus SS14]
MEYPSPVDAPPPAYEAQEFDRKIANALERSLYISRPPNAGEEVWEEWDEGRFEAASRRAHGRKSSGSDLAHERAKKHDSQAPGYGYPVASSSSPSGIPNSSRNETTSYFPGSPVEEYIDEPLPPFAPVGPSLEGPPFEEVNRYPPRFTASQADSPPQSPLDSVDGYGSYPQYPTQSSNQRYHEDGRYHPTLPREHSNPNIMPSVPAPRPPPMPFDPAVAYTSRRREPIPLLGSESREPIDAASLYNSAVSSLMKPGRQLPPPPPPSLSVPQRQRSANPVPPSGYNRPSAYGDYPNSQSTPSVYGQRQPSQHSFPAQNPLSQSQNSHYTRHSPSPQPPHVPYPYQQNVPVTPQGPRYRQSTVSPPSSVAPQWRSSSAQSNPYGGGYGR